MATALVVQLGISRWDSAAAAVTAGIPCPVDTAPDPAACSAVQLLNPGPSLTLSDKADGLDEAYQVVATASHPPSDGRIEVTLKRGVTHRNIGAMEAASETPGTWAFDWDIPTDLAAGPGTLVATLFDMSTEPPTLLSSDEAEVDVQAGAEAIKLAWPAQAGELGFFKAPDGKWRSLIEGVASAGASTPIKAYYSTSLPGTEPQFTECGSTPTTARESDGARPFSVVCTLADGANPSAITAVGAVANSGTETATGSSDVHRSFGTIQDPAQMKVRLRPIEPATPALGWPSGKRRVAGSGCLEFSAIVTDKDGRQVPGVNLDASVEGPSDSVLFSASSNIKPPDGATLQDASDCVQDGAAGEQGVLIRPDANDLKRIESVEGTGLSGPADPVATPGEWRFRVFSPVGEVGFAKVTAWIDDGGIAVSGQRNPDDDVAGADEPSAVLNSQWLEGDLTISFEELRDTATTSECHPYAAKVAGGRTLIPNANVDVHIRSDAPMRFCKLRGTKPSRLPHSGEHAPKKPGEEEEEPAEGEEPPPPPKPGTHNPETPECPGTGAPCIHREGETNSRGEFLIGLTSQVKGDVTVTAWYDGEKGKDDDTLTGFEPSVIKTTSWISALEDVKLHLVNPSPYAGVGNTVSAENLRIIARVSEPHLVRRLEVSVDNKKIGVARRIGKTDLYQFVWDLKLPAAEEPAEDPAEGEEAAEPVAIADGTYPLSVQIPGSSQRAERQITVNRASSSATDTADEWAKIETPRVGGIAPFVDGMAVVEGIASPGAEGVDLYYSTTTASDDISWKSTLCGYVDLAASSEPQPFSGLCQIDAAGGDRPSDVRAIAAVPYDCLISNCDANPVRPPFVPRGPGDADGGDARGVSGCAESQCISLSPSREYSKPNRCRILTALVGGEKGAPVVGTRVHISAKGPTAQTEFCKLPKGASRVSEHHISAETGPTGKVRFGVVSPRSGFKSIYSTVESGVTTVRAWLDTSNDGRWQPDEANDRSTLHWSLPGRCTVVGTPGDDELTASTFPDKICGRGGDDTIFGLDGATGNDIILGGRGNDTIYGQRGDDKLFGGAGDDEINGGDGNDKIWGGAGDDEINGGSGNDQIRGGPGADRCATPGKGSVTC